jgi:5-methylcytosine-specific restriction endonuclease McrA
MAKRIPWNKGLKGKQPWHNTSGLGKNIDYRSRGKSLSKARKGVPLSDEHKQALSESQTKKWQDPEYRKTQKQAMKEGNTGGWNKEPIIVHCLTCGKLIETTKQRVRNGYDKYCSKICSDRTGEKTPINLLERRKFAQTIRKEVLKRDDYTCQMCGERGGKLQVDHIQPWAEYVEGRFSMDNCRTLCQSCHYKITFGKNMKEQSKSWGCSINKISKRRFE